VSGSSDSQKVSKTSNGGPACKWFLLRRAEILKSLYRLILGISHRDHPESLKLDLSKKNEKFTKKKINCLHQVKILKMPLGGTNSLQLHSGLHSLSRATLEQKPCFFSLLPPKKSSETGILFFLFQVISAVTAHKDLLPHG